MEKAVDNLEAMFQKAETDLNYLTRKLQFQMEKAEENGSRQRNPVKLLARLEEIKSEHSALAKDVSAIQAAQKDAMDFFSSMVLSMNQALARLEAQTQQQSPELTEEARAQFEELSQLLGVSAKSILPVGDDQSDGQDLDEAPGGLAASACSGQTLAVVVSKSCSDVSGQPRQGGCLAEPQLSAHERRSQSSEFIEVSKEEFMSVSALVRGKAKLEEVNRTYRMLWQHFKEENKKEVLTPQEMNSMGLRVSGATGEAKLKILRALKLCHISKNGDVKLV